MGVQTQHRISQRRRVQRHVRRRIFGGALHRIQDRQDVALDKVDKDEVDGGIACHIGWVGADVVGNRVVGQRGVQRVVASAGASLYEKRKDVQVNDHEDKKTYVCGDVAKRQVGRIGHLYLMFPHILQPVAIAALDVSPTPQLLFHFRTLGGTSAVQGWQDLVGVAKLHVGDVVERVGKWRSRELIVLGKWSGKDVVTQFIRITDDDVGNSSARVVDREGDGRGFCNEQGQYVFTGRVWVPMGNIVYQHQWNSSTLSQDVLIHSIRQRSSAVEVSQIEIDSKLLQAIGDVAPIPGVESGVRHRGVVLRIVLCKVVREADMAWQRT